MTVRSSEGATRSRFSPSALLAPLARLWPGGGKDKGSGGGAGAFAPFEWMIAWRYLRSRRKETFISIIAGFSFVGILLGVATLIVVMAVMNGFRQELLSKILGINGHVVVQATNTPFTDYSEVAERIAFVKGVRFAVPFVEGQALASGPGGAVGAIARGMRKQDLDKLQLVSNNVKLGTLDGFDEGKGVAIGSRLAEKLALRLGDPITIVTPRGNVTPMGVSPRVKAYPVTAIFTIGMSEYDAALVFMPFAEAQGFFNVDDRASAIEVYLNDPDSVDALKKPIEVAAGRPSYLSDWRMRNVTFFSALEVERNVMFMILSLIVLVAALNIISGLTMLVKDKSHDIAILRTMGAPRGSVMRIFFINGAAIGTIGTIAGVVVGLTLCAYIEEVRQFISWLTSTRLMPPEVFFLSKMTAKIESGETVSVVLMALGLSFLATVYPAWKAARLDPVEALRYE
jgi:lipoprotein-releasing system permease protein